MVTFVLVYAGCPTLRYGLLSSWYLKRHGYYLWRYHNVVDILVRKANLALQQCLVVSAMVLSGDFLKTKILSCLIRKQKQIFHSNLVPSVAKQHQTVVGANMPICREKIWLNFTSMLWCWYPFGNENSLFLMTMGKTRNLPQISIKSWLFLWQGGLTLS